MFLRLFVVATLLLFSAIGGICYAASATTIETIVLIRHGEKTSAELGQLNDRGLNRALALPRVLIGKFGKPNYLFAPDPAHLIPAFPHAVCYVRPLATIEPTAISLGLPVNTKFGFLEIGRLQKELSKRQYANSVIFIAWEHGMEDRLSKNLMLTYAHNDSMVPVWPNDDYDSIFVIKITKIGRTLAATFTKDQEGLNSKLSNSYPGQ